MSNEIKQTAVDWFLIECGKYGDTAQIPDEVIKQAKEMEKQMTIKLYNDYENYLEEAFKNQCGGQARIMSFGAYHERNIRRK